MENLIIYVLLLLAVVAGWVFGRFSKKTGRISYRDTDSIFADYFVGLNYLLNDEPDEAIDTFIRALEINSDTVETHLALGTLLRRRGKVDKAIKVHQTLLARPALDKSFFDATRLQLAQDYIAAGLLGRAERLLKEIEAESGKLGRGGKGGKAGEAREEALLHLATLYQTEKEWDSALACMQTLLRLPKYKKDADLRSIAAHYCCELAEKSLDQNQLAQARQQIRKAFTIDRKHVRTTLLLAQLEQQQGNTGVAVTELLRVRTRHPQFSSYVLNILADWSGNHLPESQLETLLAEQMAGNADKHLVVHLANQIQINRGTTEAIAFLEKQQQDHPSLEGLVTLLRLHLHNAPGRVAHDLTRIKELLEAQAQKHYAYRCGHCGYESRNLYWLCPSCQKWDKGGTSLPRTHPDF